MEKRRKRASMPFQGIWALADALVYTEFRDSDGRSGLTGNAR